MQMALKMYRKERCPWNPSIRAPSKPFLLFPKISTFSTANMKLGLVALALAGAATASSVDQQM